jgi:hypothetical protein
LVRRLDRSGRGELQAGAHASRDSLVVGASTAASSPRVRREAL